MAKATITDYTKKYKHGTALTNIISAVLTVFPIAYYTGVAFVNGEPHEKLVLGCTITVSLILVALNVIMKMRLRSGIWILMLGIYFCIKNIQEMLIVLALTSILDELIIRPIHNYCKSKYTINKEIDRRGF